MLKTTQTLQDFIFNNFKAYANLINEEFNNSDLKTTLTNFTNAMVTVAKAGDQKEEDSADESAKKAFFALLAELRKDTNVEALSKFQNKSAMICVKHMRACPQTRETSFYVSYKEAILAAYKKDNNAIASLNTKNQSTPAAIAQALFGKTFPVTVETKQEPVPLDTKMFDNAAAFQELIIDRQLEGTPNSEFLSELKANWIRLIKSFTEVKSEYSGNGIQYLYIIMSNAKKNKQWLLDFTDETQASLNANDLVNNGNNPAGNNQPIANNGVIANNLENKSDNQEAKLDYQNTIQAVKKGRNFVIFITEQVTTENFPEQYKILRDKILEVVRARARCELAKIEDIEKVLRHEASQIAALIPNSLKMNMQQLGQALAQALSGWVRNRGDGIGAQGGATRITGGSPGFLPILDPSDPEIFLEIDLDFAYVRRIKKELKEIHKEMYDNIQQRKIPDAKPWINWKKGGQVVMVSIDDPRAYAVEFLINYELREHIKKSREYVLPLTDQQYRDKTIELCLKNIRKGLQANLLTREQAGPILARYDLGYADLDEVAEVAQAVNDANNSSTSQQTMQRRSP